ncbi:hypothetical protein E3E31_11015 [Thermococcus sp. M39]|uniref:hypothetical protein n=1 Tax=unclassified Thermococcus TaxID=2627626 RepID=UPI0014394F38|nr:MULTISPECIES: hypothetical protein [unclassified Thermococcus]NJE09042.1 hypothetical protein [Thermococcus sp. M39]NJE13293.1 hypothetical protein [Thermococcus sp. LS2]
MNEKQKKIIIFLMLFILTGPFAFLWLAALMHKEKPKIEIEQPKEETRKGKDPFEWKSIWDEESALFEEDY